MSFRILVVDDEVLIAMEIADALEAEGFEVVGPCHSVLQALDELQIPGCCDAVVLDANLRSESALPVASALLKLDIPFVVVSGYNRGQLQGDLAAGPILAKPVNTEDLVSHLQRVLAAR